MDYWYLVLVCPAVLFALIAQFSVNSRFKKYARIQNARGITGARAAQAVLDAHGVRGVAIEPVSGKLSDHFDPKAGVIRLSPEVYGASTIAAVGIAAHEAGHAVQHASGYAGIRMREAIIPVSQIGSTLSMPLVIIGLIFYSGVGNFLLGLGIIFFALATLFQVVTLPVEFDASRRAVESLEGLNILDNRELSGARSVLGAAAMTYVAALAVSLMQLLRLVLIFAGRSRD